MDHLTFRTEEDKERAITLVKETFERGDLHTVEGKLWTSTMGCTTHIWGLNSIFPVKGATMVQLLNDASPSLNDGRITDIGCLLAYINHASTATEEATA